MPDKTQVLKLQDDFYHDRFTTVLVLFIIVFFAIACLVSLSIYLDVSKPKPHIFVVGNEWRTQPAVALELPYRSTPDVLQWVGEILPSSFNFDFNNYNLQLQEASQHFTADGWKAFLNQLNNYVNYNNVQSDKLFVSGTPSSAPFVLNQGLILGRYGWWVQMPVMIKKIWGDHASQIELTLQVLVVRVPTLNNLSGIGIDNVILLKSTGRGH